MMMILATLFTGMAIAHFVVAVTWNLGLSTPTPRQQGTIGMLMAVLALIVWGLS